MSSRNQKAISDVFSRQTACFKTLIDDLLRLYPDERPCLSTESRQYARDVTDIALQLGREISPNNSHCSTLLDTCSASSDHSAAWLNWLACSPQEQADSLVGIPILESDEELPLSELATTLQCTNSYDGNEQWEDRTRTILAQGREYSGTGTTNTISTISPQHIHLVPTEESRQSNSENKADDLDEAQEVIPSKRLRHARMHATAEMRAKPSSKRRRIELSASHIELRNAIAKRLQKQDFDVAEALTDIYLATASSDARFQRKNLFDVVERTQDSITTSRPPSNMAETLRMLDTLDSAQQTVDFLRRVCFLNLWNQREAIEARLVNNGDRTTMVGKVESNVLDDLITEACPHVSPRPQGAHKVRAWRLEYDSERKSLQNRFQVAKRWYWLSERFSCGVLALIPSGGTFHVTSHKIEALSDNAFEVLLNLMDETQDDFVRSAAKELEPYVKAVLDGDEDALHIWPLVDVQARKKILIRDSC